MKADIEYSTDAMIAICEALSLAAGREVVFWDGIERMIGGCQFTSSHTISVGDEGVCVTPLTIEGVPEGEQEGVLKRWDATRTRLMGGLITRISATNFQLGRTGACDTDGVADISGRTESWTNRSTGISGQCWMHWTTSGYQGTDSDNPFSDLGGFAVLYIASGRRDGDGWNMDVFAVPVSADPELHKAIALAAVLATGRAAIIG